MRDFCDGCATALPPDSEAYVCSNGCTFCPQCYSAKQKTCANCGAELIRRPRRSNPVGGMLRVPLMAREMPRMRLIFAISFAAWFFVALAATFTIWKLYRSTEMPMKFSTTMWVELSQILSYAPLTPFVYALATLYPIRRNNWKRRTMLYLAAGLLFCMLHITIRSFSPYAIYQPKTHDWTSIFWDTHTHQISVQWDSLQKLFWNNVVDDITGTFLPIMLVAYALSYYQKFRDRELRASQLESQLTKAHLQSLKSQLQPHFLFNTMHSISALMLTDVQAADRMITRLADLLRMNLESAGTQITTLNRELEFVNCYLEIERVRFEERLTVIYQIAPETLDARVPLLLLQPLIDNAVKHGISRMTSGGEIRIFSSIHGVDLKLEVRDNGPGLTPNGGKDRGCGLGLKVTRQRLETLYGENQSVELASSPEGGVTVTVTIPFSNAREHLDAPAATTSELIFEMQERSA
jgi:two-component system LytT family sensor kinase